MPLGILFWLFWVIAVVLVGVWVWPTPANRVGGFGWFLFWLALGCLGWKVFGPVIQ